MLRIDTDHPDFRILNEVELNGPEGRGWTVVAVVQEQQTKTEQREEMCPGGNGSDGTCRHYNEKNNCNNREWLDTPVTFTQTRYLCGRSRDASIAAMTDEINGLIKDRDEMSEDNLDLREDVKKLRGELVEVTKKADHLSEQLEITRRRRDELDKENTELRQQLSLVNDDLGIISSEVGGATIREMLRKAKKAAKES